MADRDNNVYLAKLAEQAERYDEMVEAMKKVARLNTEMKPEERNLFSVGYKNIIGTRRASWRVISSIEAKEEGKGEDANSTRLEVVKSFRGQIEKELKDICGDIFEVLEKNIIPSATALESKVFFNKMKGDYHRYLAEFTSGDEKAKAADDALSAYKAASDLALGDDGLSTTHPIRLGMALNFSVFYYEILNDREKAVQLAKSAFDDAVSELDTLSEDSYKDSTLIMQLLRDNLTLWTSDAQAEGDDDDEKGGDNAE